MSEENGQFGAFLRDHIGAPEFSVGESYHHDSDWTLVIKFHAFIESSLNVLLSQNFKDSRLDNIFPELDLNDRKRGKMAFIKALDLLPKEQRSFIQKFSEIRNQLAHNAKNVDFELATYIGSLEPKKFKELSGAIIPIIKSLAPNKTEEDYIDTVRNDPRFAIFLCTVDIMLRVYDKAQVQGILEQPISTPKAP